MSTPGTNPPTDERATVKTSPTQYVLLAKEPDGDAWKVAARNVTARSSEQAVRQYAERAKAPIDKAFVLVAVPSRTWKPVTVRTQTRTAIVLEEVKA